MYTADDFYDMAWVSTAFRINERWSNAMSPARALRDPSPCGNALPRHTARPVTTRLRERMISFYHGDRDVVLDDLIGYELQKN